MPGIRRAALLAASLCLSSNALAADPYADYRIPDHHWISWTAGLTGGGSHQRRQSDYFGLLNNGSFGATGGTAFSGGYDSDRLFRAYSLSVSLNGSRGYATAEQPGAYSREELRRAQGVAETMSGFASLTTYPWKLPLGLRASTSQTLALDQSWSSSSDEARTSQPIQRSLSSANVTSGRYNAYLSLAATAGIGRVRDATPVYQVQILEERLRGTGALTRELSPGARERLAALYTIESDLAFAHERPTKYFWRELERLLREDGALATETLDAWSVQRLLEPLAFSGSAARPRGFFIGPQVMIATRRFHVSEGSGYGDALFLDDTLSSSSESPFSRRRRNFRSDAILTGFTAEYHRPVGMHWQTDAVGRALLTESGDQLTTQVSARASWFIADRWVAIASVSHAGDAFGHRLERKLDRWSFDAGASLEYFLEDAWSLLLKTELRQDHDPNYSRSEGFSLGVSHRVAGLLSAPGLMETMHRAPPTN